MRARAELASGLPIEGVRYLEHAADIGLEAEGASLAECLARAAAGVFGLMFRVEAGLEPRQVYELDLEAADDDELMVSWLQELLYRAEVDEICFLRFEVETDGDRLKGRAAGVPIRSVEPAGPGVKAVTRHGLEVGRRNGRWKARVLLDV